MDPAPDLQEHGLGPAPGAVAELLVLRPGGLGAVVKSVPALRHLRGVYPRARITVVAGGQMLELVRSCPYVDRCIDAARPSELLFERYDLAVSLAAPDSVARAPVVPVPSITAIDCNARASYRSADEAAAHSVHPIWPSRLPDTHRMLRLAWLLGGARPEPALGLWPTLADRNGAAELIGQVDAPLAIVHPGAGRPRRRWPVAGYARVLDLLSGLGVHPVVVGTSRDRQLVELLREHSTAGWSDLVGRTTVGVLVGLLERSSLFVGNDSGPATLAIALGLHSIVVGPATSLEQSGSAARVTWVAAGPCEYCMDSACDHELPQAQEVPMEVVLGQVALAARRASGRWRREQIA